MQKARNLLIASGGERNLREYSTKILNKALLPMNAVIAYAY
jgi:hypothetical protein